MALGLQILALVVFFSTAITSLSACSFWDHGNTTSPQTLFLTCKCMFENFQIAGIAISMTRAGETKRLNWNNELENKIWNLAIDQYKFPNDSNALITLRLELPKDRVPTASFRCEARGFGDDARPVSRNYSLTINYEKYYTTVTPSTNPDGIIRAVRGPSPTTTTAATTSTSTTATITITTAAVTKTITTERKEQETEEPWILLTLIVAGGVLLLLVVVVIAFLAYYIARRRKKKQLSSASLNVHNIQAMRDLLDAVMAHDANGGRQRHATPPRSPHPGSFSRAPRQPDRPTSVQSAAHIYEEINNDVSSASSSDSSGRHLVPVGNRNFSVAMSNSCPFASGRVGDKPMPYSTPYQQFLTNPRSDIRPSHGRSASLDGNSHCLTMDGIGRSRAVPGNCLSPANRMDDTPSLYITPVVETAVPENCLSPANRMDDNPSLYITPVVVNGCPEDPLQDIYLVPGKRYGV